MASKRRTQRNGPQTTSNCNSTPILERSGDRKSKPPGGGGDGGSSTTWEGPRYPGHMPPPALCTDRVCMMTPGGTLTLVSSSLVRVMEGRSGRAMAGAGPIAPFSVASRTRRRGLYCGCGTRGCLSELWAVVLAKSQHASKHTIHDHTERTMNGRRASGITGWPWHDPGQR